MPSLHADWTMHSTFWQSHLMALNSSFVFGCGVMDNYRMTNIAAAIGLAQLENAPLFLERKRAIAQHYRSLLKGTSVIMHSEAPNVRHAYWMVTVLAPTAEDRDRIRAELARHGIETRPTFYPVHTMPMYAQRYERHRVAESLGLRGINLPSYPALSADEIEEICTIVAQCAPTDTASCPAHRYTTSPHTP